MSENPFLLSAGTGRRAGATLDVMQLDRVLLLRRRDEA